ncbi:ATP-binding cassette domain-containing protein [Nonomuraea sp. NPDC050404]|uniref:ATP-binding cassette domain-containing protein n=1 Tax=Nonomuraea sp. NPDC050404 TaxID=3155783 RepID=UPI0033F57013
MSDALLARDLVRTPGARRVLDGVSLTVAPGERIGLPGVYGARLERAQERESWDADRLAGIVLDRLGLGGVPHSRTLASLSGGQRGRPALAALLIRRPAALLLDEPTNHLSPRLCDELEEAMAAGGPGAIVIASHDRWLRGRWQGHHLLLTGDV